MIGRQTEAEGIVLPLQKEKNSFDYGSLLLFCHFQEKGSRRKGGRKEERKGERRRKWALTEYLLNKTRCHVVYHLLHYLTLTIVL